MCIYSVLFLDKKVYKTYFIIGHAGLSVTLWDKDLVSPANLSRQLFLACELGMYKVTYQKIAVYFIDSFDFVDSKFDAFSASTYISQPLGYWDFINNEVSKNMFSDGLYIDNKSYQKYQNDTKKGGDFRLISNYEEIDVNFSFNVKREPITGIFSRA